MSDLVTGRCAFPGCAGDGELGDGYTLASLAEASSADPRAFAGMGGLDAMWRELGRQLAALRRAAGLTQLALARLTAFSRTTVSIAEIGRAAHSGQFWRACDQALRTGGVLQAGAQQIGAVRRAREHAAACAAQQARQARALAAFAAARDQGEVTAGVSAIQPCPHCGCPVTVLTTLIPGTAGTAPAPPGHDAGSTGTPQVTMTGAPAGALA